MVFTRQQCSGGTSSASTSGWNALFSNDLEYSGGSSGVMDRIRRNKSTNQMVLRKNEINVMDLPTEIIEHILSFLPYKNISNLRMVCRRMDGICGTRLNMTFYKLQHKMMMKFQEIKSKMPRRESARRQHPLACESDIIETLHMRLTLLQMSFGKHIEKKHCCFFPGEILDEVFRVLHYVRVTPNLTLPYKATDELFDLTSMAMEYFKEKIEPRLPEIYMKNDTIIEDKFSMVECITYETFTPQISSHLDTVTVETDESVGTTKSTMILRKRINRFRQTLRRYNTNLAFLKREMNNYKLKFNNQQKLIMEFIKRADAYEKKNEEWSRKYSTLLQELNKCVSELQYWRSNAGNVSPVRNIEEQLLGELRPSDDALIDEKQIDKEDVKDADKASTSSEELKELKNVDSTKQQKMEDRKYVEQLGTDTLNNPNELDDKVIGAHEYISSCDLPGTSTMNSDRPVSYKRKFSSNLRNENKKFKRCINLRSKSRQSSRK